MKKTLIAFGAALTCLGAAHAQSSVQVSGLVDMYYGSTKAAGDKDRVNAINSGGMTTSWWGVNGTEDLGNGLKAGFALGAFFTADDGVAGRHPGDNFFARDANVSLSGDFGTLKLGRSMAPNFLPTIVFNPFGDSFAVSPLVMHANMAGELSTTASDTGWSNQVTYSTPSFGGLSANVHYGFGESATQEGANNFGANLMYFQGPLALTAFYEQADVLGSPRAPEINSGTQKQNWMLGASYDFKLAKVYATYGQSEIQSNFAKDLEQDTVSLGVDVPVTKAGTVKFAVAHTQRDFVATSTVDTERTTATLGYDHFLSKRTDAYAAIAYDKDTNSALKYQSGTSLAVGLRHRF
ncbi:MAG: porin [Comamonas sp.]